MRTLTFVVLSISAAACSGNSAGTGTHSDAVAACVAQFSPDAGYGWQDELTTPTAPPDGGTPPTVSSLDHAVSECEAAGAASCDKSLVMTHDAATCIATKDGLAPGIAALKAGIVYYPTLRAIVWNVQNTLKDDGQGKANGDWMRLDAITGKLLDQGQWASIP